MSDDDSSSEDEITKQILRDSVDTDLLTDDLYKNSNVADKKSLDKTKSQYLYKITCTHQRQTTVLVLMTF